MRIETLRRVPWTCRWGRFGVTAEHVTATESRVDRLFWACARPGLAHGVQPVDREECGRCPIWTRADRFKIRDSG